MVQQSRAASGRGGLRVRGLSPARDALHQPHGGTRGRRCAGGAAGGRGSGRCGDGDDGDGDGRDPRARWLLLTTATSPTTVRRSSGRWNRTAVARRTAPTARTA